MPFWFSTDDFDYGIKFPSIKNDEQYLKKKKKK